LLRGDNIVDSMKRILVAILAVSLTAVLAAQKDTVTVQTNQAAISENSSGVIESTALKIYPVPVKENNFHVASDKEISSIRITNIIGQEIYRNKYSTPVLTTQVFLTNTRRGMYLVTVTLTDNTRIVRKIMIEAVQ